MKVEVLLRMPQNFCEITALDFVLCSNGQIYGGDFAKFCGLLRIYELYQNSTARQLYVVEVQQRIFGLNP